MPARARLPRSCRAFLLPALFTLVACDDHSASKKEELIIDSPNDGAAEAAAESHRAFQQAERLLWQDRMYKAKPLLEQATFGCWDSLRYHERLQDCLGRTADDNCIRACYAKHLRLEPELAANWYLAGHLLTDPRQAKVYYQRVLQLEPGFGRAYLGMAWSCLSNGDWSAALGFIRKARQIGVDDPEYAWIAGLCYQELGDDGAALAAYERYLLARPVALQRSDIVSRVKVLRGDYGYIATCFAVCLGLATLWMCFTRRRIQRDTRFSWRLCFLMVGAGALFSAYILARSGYWLMREPFDGLAHTGRLADEVLRHVAVVGPLEESAKWLVAVALALLLRRVRTPLDGIALAAYVAMGFAFCELYLYSLNNGLFDGASRFLTGMPTHMAESSIWGYALGMVPRKGLPGRAMARLAACLVLGSLVHGLDNTLIEAVQWKRALGDASPLSYMHLLAFALLMLAYWALVRWARKISVPVAIQTA